MKPMRRKDRELTKDEAFAILRECEYAALATINEDKTPYCIMISPVVMNENIYFHCAKEGQKLDNIAKSPHVCITCAKNTRLVPEHFTTLYESAVVYGTARLVENDAEKIAALKALCEKYASSNMSAFEDAIHKSLHRTGICEITIDHITGKAKR